MKTGNCIARWLLPALGALVLLMDGPAWATAVSLDAQTPQLKGRKFGVTVSVDAVADAFGIACDLVYDPEYLELVGNVIEGELFNEGDSANNPTLAQSALEDGVQGTLVLGLTRSGNVAGVTTDVPKDIVTVSFIPKQEGTTEITFKAQALIDSTGADINVDPWSKAAIEIQILKGDVDGTFIVDLADAVTALKIMNNIAVGKINPDADVDEDRSIGLGDVIYILQLASGTREAE